jgi:hypothetical protein
LQKLKVRFSLIENDQVGYLNSKRLFAKGGIGVLPENRTSIMEKKAIY